MATCCDVDTVQNKGLMTLITAVNETSTVSILYLYYFYNIFREEAIPPYHNVSKI